MSQAPAVCTRTFVSVASYMACRAAVRPDAPLYDSVMQRSTNGVSGGGTGLRQIVAAAGAQHFD